MTNTTCVFQTLKSNAMPVMDSYQSDLEHDARWIEENPGVGFIHVTRANGTHIYEFPDAEKLRSNTEEPFLFGVSKPSEIYKGVLALLSLELAESGLVFQVYDGRRLSIRTPAQGRDDYSKALKRAESVVRH